MVTLAIIVVAASLAAILLIFAVRLVLLRILKGAKKSTIVESVSPPRQVSQLSAEKRFSIGLTKARELIGGYLSVLSAAKSLDSATLKELQEMLIRADVGVQTTNKILEHLKQKVALDGQGSSITDVLAQELKTVLCRKDRGLHLEPGYTNVWLFVGVNGTGKTTTIGKIAFKQLSEGRSVVLAAGDTFRAAATEQLQTWGERVGVLTIKGSPKGDPGAVVFDAVQHAIADGIDLVLADTAGRLHTNSNLMEELKKVKRVACRATKNGAGYVSEVLLILDATVGQNGLVQAKQFTDNIGVTGVVLTKLDTTAKGGIVLAIESELGVPVKLVGIGETPQDLLEFNPDEFVEGLLKADV